MAYEEQTSTPRQAEKWKVAVRDETEALDRRHRGRISVQGIATELGKVVDLSVAGMRIVCGKHKPAEREVLDLELRHPDGSVPIRGRTVWVRRMSRGHHELGISFEDVNASTHAALVAIVRLAVESITAELRVG